MNELQCTLNIYRENELVNTLEFTGAEALKQLAKAQKDVITKKEVPSIKRVSYVRNYAYNELKIVVFHQAVMSEGFQNYKYDYLFKNINEIL